MTRALASAPIGILVFVTILAMAAVAVRNGFLPNDALVLWAGAITAGGGGMPVGLVAAAYPTIPFVASTLLEILVPTGTPAPALLAAGVGGLLACAWYRSLRTAGLSLLAAGATTLLLILHPGLLRPAVTGPSEILLVAFLYLFASGLYDLRARSGVPEVMTVGLALVGLAFSHPMGAAIACAAAPFLILVVSHSLVANSAVSVVLTLAFPAVFSTAAFAYVSWIFPGSGWSFLIAPAEGISTWTASFTHGYGGVMTGVIAFDAGIALALTFLLSAPVVVVAMIWMRRRHPLVIPALVLAVTTVAAAVIAVATGLFGDPVALTAVPPVLAAAVVMRMPELRSRLAIVLPLLMIGWVGGAVAFKIVDPRIIAHAGAVLAHVGADPVRADALDLGGALVGREGVLVDSTNSPAVIVGRGSAKGLIMPPDEDFGLAIRMSAIGSHFVAVPDPQSNSGAQDRLNKAFPQVYQRGPPGYELVYQNASWRLFGRRNSRRQTGTTVDPRN